MQHPPASTVSPKHHVGHAAHTAAAVQPVPVAALEYHLPAACIATHPVQPRDSAKMLVLSRSDESFIEHRCVRDLPAYLHAGDALVFNTTAVVPARLELQRPSGGKVEGLFLETSKAAVEGDASGLEWMVMLRSGGRLAIGDELSLTDRDGCVADVSLRIVDREGDRWRVVVKCEDRALCSTQGVLDRVGRTPLPPYIRKARSEHHETYSEEDDHRWYQTVYADNERAHSVAAPTAGLHFTDELLARIDAMGVKRIDVALHVGPGTFKPVSAATLDQHVMHAERFEVSAAALKAIGQTAAATGRGSRKQAGGAPPDRIIAVGTTSVRTLESLPASAFASDCCGLMRGTTDLMIAPPFDFRVVDGLLTNFHLPRSTLLALVGAMVGLDRLLAVYREAIDRGYRFYSYGDAMLILP